MKGDSLNTKGISLGFSVVFISAIGYAIATTGFHSPGYSNKSRAALQAQTAVDSPTVELIYPITDPLTPVQNTGNNSINLLDPLNIQHGVEYDPVTGQYYFNSTYGNQPYHQGTGMTMEEYRNYEFGNSIKQNWQEIVAADAGTGAASKGGLKIPDIPLNKDKDKGWLGDKIEIKPSGSAELIFGLNTSRTANPQIPEKQRKITIFDFNQRIQINLLGNIGDKMKLNFNYNTEATFDFENQIKLEYKGTEDEIIQSVEAGNVSLPLTGTLITGAQSLFGIKIGTKWGRLTNTTVLSQNKGKRTEIEVKGGAQTQNFEITADNYEANKHYFLAQYFRGTYDRAMQSLPTVNSSINIKRVEVWVTNTNNTVDNTRNFVAFADLAETSVLQTTTPGPTPNPGSLPQNEANNLYHYVANNSGVRSFNNAANVLAGVTTSPGPFQQGINFEKVQNARMLAPTEYAINTSLGFISLNAPLNNDEVLAVAYQYVYQGQTYQVGEFSTDGVAGQNALVLKLLKGTITNPRFTRWDLMMKNVYNLSAYQISRDNFRLDVWYNNPSSSIDINYLPYSGVDGRPLIQVVDMDRYDQNNNPFPDGIFDFMPLSFNGNLSIGGGTINPQNGRIYFTTVEPFGTTLKNKLVAAGLPTATINAVVFQPLYDSTKTAAQQIPLLNRFKIKGQYQSASGSEISLNAINIPQGSVIVTAGGVPLVENQDYRVDYNLGRVTIINQSLLESQTPIKVSLESNTLFSMQTKTMIGSRFDYKVNRDINIGGTIMNLTERPLTQKINIGDEPISNWMVGLDASIKKEVPFITRLVDKIPLINTKEKSMLTANFEVAKIIPGTARAINGLSYIDDFEGSQSAIDLRSQNSWVLASTPKGQSASSDLFPEAAYGGTDPLSPGYNRALLNWFVIDPLFHLNNNLTPGYIKNSPMQSNQLMRVVYENNVFPNRQLATGQPTNIAVFNLAFYPSERGPYNYLSRAETNPITAISTAGIKPDGSLNLPEDRWGGIMRPLTTTDFELANINYIQFWVMDPFNTDAENMFNSQGGDLYFNLGNVSEDILPDSRKSFENGIPPSGDYAAAIANNQLTVTDWGYVPTIQPIVNAFDNSGEDAARINQDVGLDGLKTADEANFFSAYISAATAAAPSGDFSDPSSDNYHYYRGDDYDAIENNILERYKKYNGHEGNSPTTHMAESMNADKYPTSANTLPNVEDINFDNNLSETESYFQYKVSIRPQDMEEGDVGTNFITNIVVDDDALADGSVRPVKWYQFRIPIRDPQKIVNSIQDFRSIRFIRMFLRGCKEPLVLRFARLELIRGEWRAYRQSLLEPGEAIVGDPSSTLFDVSAVNIEEHGSRYPINYQIPPGINRQVDVTTANLRNLNEQALSMDICGLEDGDARACYRNVQFDIRSYKRLKMFVHAETSSQTDPCKDDDVVMFVRLGTDFEENYYEYELPLKMTPWGASTAEDVWLADNEVDIEFDKLVDFKLERNAAVSEGVAQINQPYESRNIFANRIVRIKGNPNLQGIKTVMVGVRNPRKAGPSPYKPDDGKSKCLEVWINELRLTDFDQHGGWAATARVNTNLADFGNLALSGSYSTPYWGSIEKRVSERQRETIMAFDAISSFELGKFFPEEWGIRLPMYLSYGENRSNPQFDPLQPDVLYPLSTENMTPDEKAAYHRKSQNYTRRRSINFANVKKERTGSGKPHFYDISNWSFTYAYNEIFHRDINIEYNMNKTYRGGANYSFNKNSKPWEPFAKSKFLGKSKWFSLIKDFNLYLAPKVVAFRNEISRSYIENIIRANYGALAFPNYTKNFFWTRGYDVKYDITKNLKFDYTGVNNGVIGEPTGRINRLYRDEYQTFKDSVQSSLRQGGTTTHYNHTINLTYQLPLSKIPITDWITVNAKYSAGYDWQRAPFGQDTLGHIIQNSRNVSLNGQLNFVTLYNKVPFLKKINQKAGGQPAKRPTSPGKAPLPKNQEPPKDSTANKKDKDKEGKFTLVENIFRVLMGVKNASVTFSTTDGILLPGYGNKTQFLGMNQNWSAPSYGFILGKQNTDIFGNPNKWGEFDEYAFYAANNGWLVKNQNLNREYVTNHAKNFQGKVTVEPLTGLKIDLNIDKNISQNTNSFFRYVDTLPSGVPVNDYQLQNPMMTGVMSMSINCWKTAFARNDKETYSNPVFDQMRDNRIIASTMLANANPHTLDSIAERPLLDSAGYYYGYGGTQQDVVISSFIAAYTGSPMDQKFLNPLTLIPKPNWRVTFDPMAKAKWKFFKRYFRSLTLSHGYRSTLNIANYSTNLQAQVDNDGFLIARNINGNFYNTRLINTITIAEQFSPLFSMDIKWKMNEKDQRGLITKLEIKRDRNITLSLTNNQITEIRSKEYVFGTGYTFPKLKLPFKIAGKKPESDLEARADVSIRDNVTVTRKIVENYNQPTSGQMLVSIKTSVNYTVAQNISIRLFFDKTITDPKVSNSFRTSNASSGIAIRLSLQ